MRHGTLLTVVLLVLALARAPAGAAEIPPWLPRYDLDVRIDVDGHSTTVRERVTWTNRHETPANELVFNVHSHFKIPDKDIGTLAKTLEILRILPSEGLDFEGNACQIHKVTLLETPRPDTRSSMRDAGPSILETRISLTGADETLPAPRTAEPLRSELDFHYREDNDTALVVPLPRPVRRGESVTIELEFDMRLPQKQGRWGQWQGVTFLSNWLPVLAFYDDKGWQPTPFVPWHQPFFNEAGAYRARIELPGDQKVACTGTVRSVKELENGLKELVVETPAARDFAIVCSARYVEYVDKSGPVHVRCLAFPEHEHYARIMLASACHAIPVYSRWFGPFPYPEFTIVESFFGWNGNECGGLIMIDERIFNMPHIGEGYVDYLISHETCHQWWYNVVGTNGFCETWMDEGLATYFSYRLIYAKHGKDSSLIGWPSWLEWMPNIRREDYRTYGLLGTLKRGEGGPTVQEMPKFGHVVNLFSMCYDKGSKIVGMIEDRMGEAAFFDFIRRIQSRYYFRILRVADFQRELEEYTGQSWDEFFQRWLYGSGMTDWSIDKVTVEKKQRSNGFMGACASRFPTMLRRRIQSPCKVTVMLRQKAEYTEPTVLGICLDDSDKIALRIPILPGAPLLDLEEVGARVESLPNECVRVEVDLPCEPTEITVDPDNVLLDCNRINNCWNKCFRFRFSPLCTFLDETDLSCAHDKWNVIAGPWVYTPTYANPWFNRATMFGMRSSLYQTQFFDGGAYAAYRTNYRDIVAGVDGLWDHWPWAHTQVGFIAEERMTGALAGERQAARGVLFGRYVIDYGDSLYLPPFQYVELFSTLQDNMLPFSREMVPGAERFTQQAMAGVHYHKNYLTPYWDAQGGYQLDVTYASGAEVSRFDDTARGSQQLSGQFSVVKGLPDCLGVLSETRLAARIFAAAGTPDRVQFFAMGGSELLRGYDLAQRQGSMVWVGSLEWRVPLKRDVDWDCCDRVASLRHVNAALFYDVGDAYVRGHSMGPVAHALGVGLRLDVAWFAFVERTIIRLDMARTINDNTPMQFWIGVGQPF